MNAAGCYFPKRWRRPRGAAGFTLVELLVVIAIIGVLVALLLPAIQAARESARRTQCKNQLRQLALTFQLHHDTQKYLPSGGWSFLWLGFPEQGFGKSQSGSWMYSVLPYMEQSTIYNYGRGATGTARREACKQRVQMPFEGMTCPSRRQANVYPFEPGGVAAFRYCMLPLQMASKTDYAANGGFVRTTETSNGLPNEGGDNLLAVNAADYVQSADGDLYENWNGVVFYKSEVNFRQVTDGTSRTYMVGEKWMNTRFYETGEDNGDNEPAFAGNNNDTIRMTHTDYPLAPDTGDPRDKRNPQNNIGRRIFGSAHEGGFNMAMCDASVNFVSTDIDPVVHGIQGGRDDGDSLPAVQEIFR
jgi:prepilin-type N-terminal cleavage/methylation domain-containing protein